MVHFAHCYERSGGDDDAELIKILDNTLKLFIIKISFKYHLCIKSIIMLKLIDLVCDL